VAVTKWRDLGYLMPQPTSRRYDLQWTRYDRAYRQLLIDRPLAERAFVSITGPYLSAVIFPTYGRTSVHPYNAEHKTDIGSFEDLAIARTCPPASQPKQRAEWLTFVRELLNSSFIRTTVDDQSYRSFLIERYGAIADLNRSWGSDYRGFDAINLPPDTQWLPAAVRVDYRSFLDTLPDDALYLVGPEFAWRDWLARQYTNLEAASTAHRIDYTDWMQVRLPMAELETAHVRSHATALRWQFATSNYSDVIDEVIVQGRPFLNTLVYVGLSLVLTLTLQPLAAYALSRFNPPGTWRLILIFMATMAFPPMVGLIPQFLILRQLNLLNTFIALTLPIIVNGYLIFLLKGFFDSLPHHLYEAALIDGASELRMFWEITMALSRPILAVVALQTFNHAWIAFMYPLLVCPDESMHVLAVWLYQFQNEAPTSAVFAAIVVTSIPTLLLFVLTQRTIMRGIAVPAEK
jgi:multiple sugar transport system permease protein